MVPDDSQYRNFDHYIREGWSEHPKESAKRLLELMQMLHTEPIVKVLDVGCATGELLHFLRMRLRGVHMTGADVFDELLNTGRRLLPGVEFVNASVLELPMTWESRFDHVTAMGVMSIFDFEQLQVFWKNLLRVTRPGGWVTVLTPLNEYGVDTLILHRKRQNGMPLAWEKGWNVFAIETVRDCLAAMGQTDLRIDRFLFDQKLEQRADPVRTWTLPTAANPNQLTNGLKLLIDHSFISVRKW